MMITPPTGSEGPVICVLDFAEGSTTTSCSHEKLTSRPLHLSFRLHLLPRFFLLLRRYEGSTVVAVTCQMQKRLLELPEDACPEIQGIKNHYVIEQWSGEANLEARGFKLDRIDLDNPPIHTTIDFDNTPVLKRDVLAGCYEFVLEESREILESVHRSWVEIAHLEVEQAVGFMLRVPAADPVCSMLLPEQASDVDAKLGAARSFLKETKVHKSGENRIVNYNIKITRVSDIQTRDETFYADLVITKTFRVTRKDVFAYVVKPLGWKPSWEPKSFSARNAVRSMDISMTSREPRLVVNQGADGGLEVCASQTDEYSGTFRNEYSLKSFPFDVQTLSIEFRIINDELGVEYFCKDGTREDVRAWTYREDNSEWDAIDTWTHVEKPAGAGYIELTAVVRMDRVSFVYIMRIVCVNLLIMVLTMCIFVLDMRDDIGDRLGHAFTMLLTAVAYSLVVADSLPTLGYLTWLDKYIFGTYFFLAAVVVEFTMVVSPYVTPEIGDILDKFFLLLNTVALVLMQIYFYVTAQAEINKTKLLRKNLHNVQLKNEKDASFLPQTTNVAGPKEEP